MPWPTGHVRHAEQESRPGPAVNVSGAQLEHCRSLVDVASASVCVPASQGGRTGVQAAPELVAEKLSPTTQEVHSRLAVAEPALDMPEPAGHVDHAVHFALPSDVEYCSLGQFWH
jgi:hypothetical protein